MPPSRGTFVYNASKSNVTNMQSAGRGSKDSKIEIIWPVSLTKEGSCSARGLMK